MRNTILNKEDILRGFGLTETFLIVDYNNALKFIKVVGQSGTLEQAKGIKDILKNGALKFSDLRIFKEVIN